MMRSITWHLFLVLLPFIFIPFNSNNSCGSYLSYLFISFSSDCYHNPDINDNIVSESSHENKKTAILLQTNVIQRHTNSSETHQVQTEDGYVLDLFRIHRKNPRGVILFQHSFLFDARIWVNQKNDSVAFFFWKAGYDVWLGNSRGNFYAKKHVRLRPSDPEFWNYRYVTGDWLIIDTKFSLSELGYFDLNATIEYIKATTNQRKIIYVGHSLGGTTGLIYASMRPEDALNSLQIMITMASGTTFKYGYGMVRTAVPVSIMMQVGYWILSWAVTLEVSARRRSDKSVKNL
jgi:pimeloyl-ACP methyl ester carboxylesterase